MKLYEKYYGSNYEELITYYPRFYREVFEMVEILKAHGRIADELEDNIEQTFLNCFIDYADEPTITKFERFLKISLNKSRTLEDRRQLVKSFFVGFGKVSAKMLKEMIYTYTNSYSNIIFEPSDEFNNNTLYVYIYLNRGAKDIYKSDIKQMLSKKIPAHVNFETIFQYSVDGNANIYTGLKMFGKHKKICTEVKNYGLE